MNTKKFVTSAASVITAGALVIGGTMAYFTDSQTSTGNTLGAGTLNIELNELGGSGGNFVPINVTNLAPDGDSAFKCAMVRNAGTLPFNWTMKATETSGVSPNLANALWGKTYLWNSGTSPTSEDCSNVDDERWQLVEAEIPPYGMLSALPIAPLLGTEGPQGLLANGAEKFFMWEYYLPEDVDNTYNGATTTLTFEVKAYQTNDGSYPGTP